MPPSEGKEEKWFGGIDKEKRIFTDELFNNYFVFDIINGERRYDVPRIETGQNNRDIRFKLRGGDNEGLSLIITDYHNDEEI